MERRLSRLDDVDVHAFLAHLDYDRKCLLRDEFCWRLQEIASGDRDPRLSGELAQWTATQIRGWRKIEDKCENFLWIPYSSSMHEYKFSRCLRDLDSCDARNLIVEFIWRLENQVAIPKRLASWASWVVENLPFRQPRESTLRADLRRFVLALEYHALLERKGGKRRTGNLPSSAEEVGNKLGASPSAVKAAYKKYKPAIELLVRCNEPLPVDTPTLAEAEWLLGRARKQGKFTEHLIRLSDEEFASFMKDELNRLEIARLILDL